MSEIKLSTGTLTLEQLELIFTHIPVEITFVDETDTIKFFSREVNPIFTRESEILETSVVNCHSPAYHDIVNQMLNDFREGLKNEAEFLEEKDNKKILVKYFAVRDQNGLYKGIIEVVQDISEITKE